MRRRKIARNGAQGRTQAQRCGPPMGVTYVVPAVVLRKKTRTNLVKGGGGGGGAESVRPTQKGDDAVCVTARIFTDHFEVVPQSGCVV